MAGASCGSLDQVVLDSTAPINHHRRPTTTTTNDAALPYHRLCTCYERSPRQPEAGTAPATTSP